MKALGLTLLAVAIGFLIVYSPIIVSQIYQVPYAQTGAYNTSEREMDYGTNDLNTTNSIKGQYDSLALLTSAPFGMPLGPFVILAFSSIVAFLSYLILRKLP